MKDLLLLSFLFIHFSVHLSTFLKTASPGHWCDLRIPVLGLPLSLLTLSSFALSLSCCVLLLSQGTRVLLLAFL